MSPEIMANETVLEAPDATHEPRLELVQPTVEEQRFDMKEIFMELDEMDQIAEMNRMMERMGLREM